jgi:uncharacterized repeat protein (TIGR02543 family)
VNYYYIWRTGIIKNGGKNATLNLINSTVANNASIGFSADNTSKELGNVHFYNNIFYNNKKGTYECDIYVDYKIANEDNVITNVHNNIIGKSNDLIFGSNNLIGEDPLFVGNGDYSLQENSPAIDKGDNTYLAAEITEDLFGNLRISNGTVDMGAYEFQQEIYHTVNFAGEEISIDPQVVEYGKHIPRPADPQRTNYKFGGWFTDNDTFTNEWNFATHIVTQDTTLYAKWNSTVGITETESAAVKIYPNPAKDELQIESGDLRIIKVEIVDLSGRTLLLPSFGGAGGGLINVSPLPQGIYFVKIETDKGTVTRKFVKL